MGRYRNIGVVDPDAAVAVPVEGTEEGTEALPEGEAAPEDGIAPETAEPVVAEQPTEQA